LNPWKARRTVSDDFDAEDPANCDDVVQAACRVHPANRANNRATRFSTARAMARKPWGAGLSSPRDKIAVSKNRAKQGGIRPCTDYSGRMAAVPGKNSGSRAISWDRRRHAGIPVGAPARSVDRIRAESTGPIDRPASRRGRTLIHLSKSRRTSSLHASTAAVKSDSWATTKNLEREESYKGRRSRQRCGNGRDADNREDGGAQPELPQCFIYPGLRRALRGSACGKRFPEARRR